MAGKCSLENKQVNTIEKSDSLGSPASQSNFSGPAFVIQYFRLKNNPMPIEQPDPMISNKVSMSVSKQLSHPSAHWKEINLLHVNTFKEEMSY